MQIMILISDVGHCLRVADHEMAGRPTWRPGTSAKWSNLFAEEVSCPIGGLQESRSCACGYQG